MLSYGTKDIYNKKSDLTNVKSLFLRIM